MAGRIVEIAARQTWTLDDAREVLAAWKQSGLSVAEFSRRHEFDKHRLYAWRRKLSVTAIGGFVPVRVVSDSPAGTPVELEVRGVRVRVGRDFDEATLRRVLSLLEVA